MVDFVLPQVRMLTSQGFVLGPSLLGRSAATLMAGDRRHRES